MLKQYDQYQKITEYITFTIVTRVSDLDILQSSDILEPMSLCKTQMFANKIYWLQKSVVLVATLFLVIGILYFSPITYADTYADTHPASDGNSTDNNASKISISSTGDNYSLSAKQAKLPDVLQELGEAADFEFKLFENSIVETSTIKTDWNFDAVPLNQLLNNLIRGYNTIMLYEDTKNVIQDNNNRKLKEL